MEYSSSDAHSLALIDQEIGSHEFSPTGYIIVRQVVYATGDFDYKDQIVFSPESLHAGAAALAVRTPVIVDSGMVRAGLLPIMVQTFVNPLYCATEANTRPQVGKSASAWGLETLAKLYPEGIFVIGQDPMALAILLDLMESGEVKPALIVATPPVLLAENTVKERLGKTTGPYIYTKGAKGGPVVAATIISSLLQLAWRVYRS